MDRPIDVLGIGNALVDLLVEVEDAVIARHDLPRGGMLLTDAARFAAILADVEPIGSVGYGGNACNTTAAVASLGCSARFVGKIADDPLGAMFRRELADAGVAFSTPPLPAGAVTTASCLILVTPDGQRTGVTHLGACGALSVDDLPEQAIASARVTFQEAYSLDREPSAGALWRGAEIARAAGRLLALTLSDPHCVARHRSELIAFIDTHRIDLLFANESEALAMSETDDLAIAIAFLRLRIPVIAVTRGAAGSLVVAGGLETAIEAPRVKVVDTTGAGDHYAAGFMAGWLNGRSAVEAGVMGAQAAAAVIGHLGAKPTRTARRPGQTQP